MDLSTVHKLYNDSFNCNQPLTVDNLTDPLLQKIFSVLNHSAEHKMKIQLVSKRFFKLINNKDSWTKDDQLIFVIKNNAHIVNSKNFSRTDVPRAIFKYMHLTTIACLVVNVDKAEETSMKTLTDPLHQNKEKLLLSTVSVTFDAKENYNGISVLFQTLSQSAGFNLVNFCFTLTTNGNQPVNTELLSSMIHTHVFSYAQKCSKMLSLQVKSAIPDSYKFNELLALVLNLTNLTCLSIKCRHIIIPKESSKLSKAINLLNLQKLLLKVRMYNIDQFIDDHNFHQRIAIKYLRLTPDDFSLFQWSASLPARILDYYPNLLELDINYYDKQKHWEMDAITVAVNSILRTLAHRNQRSIQLKMRTFNIPEFVIANIRKISTDLHLEPVEREKNVYICYLDGAFLKLNVN